MNQKVAGSVWCIALLAGCQPRTSLVDHSLWTPLSAEEDPAPDRPDSVDCPAAAIFVETVPETALEVDTGACDYLALGQPTLSRVRGGLLHLRFGHGELEAAGSFEAHVAVYLGDALAFSQRLEIPSPEAEYEVDLDGLEPVPAGEPIVLHLHNHGANAWSFAELSTGR